MTKIEKVNKWFLSMKLPKELRAYYLLCDKQIICEKENSWLISARYNNDHFEFWCPNLEKEKDQREL